MCDKHYRRHYLNSPDTQRERYDRTAPCAVEGCGSSANGSLGYCRRHYARVHKHGDPLFIKPTRVAERVNLPDETSPSKLARLLGVSRQRAHHLLNRQSLKARAAVHYAVKTGRIVKPSACERCGEAHARLEAHHWDYHEELDVRWLCPPCHSIVHPHHPTVHGKSNRPTVDVR